MSTPTFHITADRSALTYRIQSVDLTDLTGRPVRAAGATAARTAPRDIQSRDLTALAQTEGPLLTAFRAAARRKVELDAAAAAAAQQAQLAFLLCLFTLFLVPPLRRKRAAARQHADQAKEAAGLHMARIRHEGNPGDLTTLWDRVAAAGTAALGSQRVWDITSQSRVNQRAERSAAGTSLSRVLVTGGTAAPAFLDLDRPVLCFGNANGHPIFLCPTFLVVGTDPSNAVFVDLRTVKVEHVPSRFHEEEGVPSDSTVVDHTWKYTNKNGTRDKRFKDNFQIPIVRYHRIFLSSPSGLDECFMFSNAAAAERFGAALTELVDRLRALELRVTSTAA